MEGLSANSSSSASAAPLSYGLNAVIGKRAKMEDAVAAAPSFLSLAAGSRLDFFGVFDGHGGSAAAAICQKRMHVVLAEEAAAAARATLATAGAAAVGTAAWWGEVMRRAFARVDEEVMGFAEARPEKRTVGSTAVAVVVLVGPAEIVVANCGDSRVVLYGGGRAVPLSRDHKPERADELKRIEDAGGEVINWQGHRVQGVLATSRSLGDYYLKPYVIPDPDVTVVERSNDDEFLILASDGLWDVLSNESAGQVARYCLTGAAAKNHPQLANQQNADVAATMLAKFAVMEGSTDNVGVVVVELKSMGGAAPPPPPL